MGSFGGALVSGLTSDKPDVPDLPRINIVEEQRRAIEENLKVLPEISRLSAEFSKEGALGIKDALRAVTPEYDRMEGLLTDEIISALRGELPADVQRVIARRAAERGISTGTGGSQFAEFGELESIGQTSLQRISQGLDTAMKWMNFQRTGIPVMDATSMFVTPMQRADFEFRQNMAQWQQQWLESQVDAMPSPGMAALASAFDTLDANVWNLASAAIGGATGGNSKKG